MIKRLYILLLMGLMPMMALAQPADAYKAVAKHNNKEIDSAVYYIDRAIVTVDGMNDPQVWMFRGYIYKSLYKERHRADKSAESREIAVESILKALKMDSTGEYSVQLLSALNYLSNTYLNDAFLSLNVDEYRQAKSLYERHKELAILVDPTISFKEADIQYYGVLGSSVYSIFYDQGGPDKDIYRDKAIECYHEVLKLDSNDFLANYNLGVIYYNIGVRIINTIPEEAPIPEIEGYQDEAAGYFSKALPYLDKAYEINPYRREVYIAKAGIYFAQYELEKKDLWTEKLKELDKKLEENPELNKSLRDFNATLEAVRKFVETNKRMPEPTASNSTEKSLAIWVKHIRTDYRNKQLPDTWVQKIESIDGWTWE